MIVEYSVRAASELEDIADYYRAIGAADAGENIIREIYRAVDLLREAPFIGRRQSIEGVRKLVVARTNYLAYYLVDSAADEVVILSIRHAARARQFRDD